MKKNIKDWTDDEEVKDYLNKLLNKEAFDKITINDLLYGLMLCSRK